MVAVTLDQFVEQLAHSGLFTAAEIVSFRESFAPDQQPKDVETLARELVRAKKLTKYQATMVYQGKTKGLVFGDYRVLDKLGEGGMGVVLKAEHRRMERIVAVKMISAAALKSPDAVKRFYREVKAAGRLNHTNVVTAYDACEYDGVHYLIMEYVEGKDLGTLVKDRGPLPISRAIDYVVQAARGLQYAHKQGIVHRDIKPANLLVDKEGTVKILDMGLASVAGMVDEEDKDRLTASGQVMGTLDYMSPEQAMDTHHADSRADIYSLGCTLYRILTNEPIFKGETLAKILMSHQIAPVPSLGGVRNDVSPKLDAVFQKMVAKKPEERQQTMADVIAELEACTGKQASASVSVHDEATSDFGMNDNLSFLRDQAAHRGVATGAKKKGEELREATLSQQAADAESSRQLSHDVRLLGIPLKKKTVKIAIAAGLAGIVAAMAMALIIRIRRPDGTEQVIREPDRTEVSTRQEPSPAGATDKRWPAFPALPADGAQGAKPKGTGAEGKQQPSPVESSSERLVLFDGHSLAGWHLRHADAKQSWKAEEDQLVCTPREQSTGANLCTDGLFDDFELHLEFLLAENANSGVYLRGLYEVQLIDDPHGSQLSNTSCGALFKAFAPVRKAYLGAGQWNALDVKLVGQQVTVTMNGVAMIENATLTQPTDTKHTLPLAQGAPGPIMLQCLGQSPSRFRNLWIRTVPKPGATPPPAVAPFDAAKARQHQEDWAKHLGVPVEQTNAIGMKLVLIPPGEFDMGSTAEEIQWTMDYAKKNERPSQWDVQRVPTEAPRHRVKITKPFCLGMYPVTQAEYEKVMGVNPSNFTEKQIDASDFNLSEGELKYRVVDDRRKVAGKDTSRHPVETVSWEEAVEFCRRLSALPAEQAARRVYRLPTEVEFECACRAGSTTRWYCGDDVAALEDAAWFRKNSRSMTHPVGEKAPNAWQLFDMSGNVAQWCADWYVAEYYQQSSADDPGGPAAGKARVIRGCHWNGLATGCRSSARTEGGATTRNRYTGFRVVCQLDAKAESGERKEEGTEAPRREQETGDSLRLV